MIKIGSTSLKSDGGMYVGSTKIRAAYVGSTLVYQISTSPAGINIQISGAVNEPAVNGVYEYDSVNNRWVKSDYYLYYNEPNMTWDINSTGATNTCVYRAPSTRQDGDINELLNVSWDWLYNITYVNEQNILITEAGSSSFYPESTKVGNLANPYYWDDYVDSTNYSNRKHTVAFEILSTHEQVAGDQGDRYVTCFYIHLTANTTYNMGINGQGDQYIYLFDSNGSVIEQDDDSGAGTIDGVATTDGITYAPSTTGWYILGASTYSGGLESGLTLHVDPAPDSDGSAPVTPVITLLDSQINITGTVGTALPNIDISTSVSVTPTGTPLTYTAASALPAGLSLNNGVLSGTPTATSSSTIGVVISATGATSQTINLVFNISEASHTYVYTVSGAGTAEANGDYWEEDGVFVNSNGYIIMNDDINNTWWIRSPEYDDLYYCEGTSATGTWAINDGISPAPTVTAYGSSVTPVITVVTDTVTVSGTVGTPITSVDLSNYVSVTPAGTPLTYTAVDSLPSGLSLNNGILSGTSSTTTSLIAVDIFVSATGATPQKITVIFDISEASHTYEWTVINSSESTANGDYWDTGITSAGYAVYTNGSCTLWYSPGAFMYELYLGVATDDVGTGLVSLIGDPTAGGATSPEGTYSDGAEVVPYGSSQTITISAVSSTINITGTAGTAISQTDLNSNVQVTPAGTNLTFSASGLPAGLSLSSEGVLSGTPTAASSANVTVTVQDMPNLTTSATFTLSFSIAEATPVSFPDVLVVEDNTAAGTGGTYTKTSQTAWDYPVYYCDARHLYLYVTDYMGGGYRAWYFRTSSLPDNSPLEPIDILQMGEYPCADMDPSNVVPPQDSSLNWVLAGMSLDIPDFNISEGATINPVISVVTATTNVSGTVGNAITSTDLSSCVSVTPSGTALTFAATGLPAGLSLSSAGVLSGTPTASSSDTVTVTVSATGAESVTLTLVFSIADASHTVVYTVSGATIDAANGGYWEETDQWGDTYYTNGTFRLAYDGGRMAWSIWNYNGDDSDGLWVAWDKQDAQSDPVGTYTGSDPSFGDAIVAAASSHTYVYTVSGAQITDANGDYYESDTTGVYTNGTYVLGYSSYEEMWFIELAPFNANEFGPVAYWLRDETGENPIGTYTSGPSGTDPSPTVAAYGGTPSVITPVITLSQNSANVTGETGTAITSLDISQYVSVTPSDTALTYTASGLPTGLSLSAAGVLSGTPSAASSSSGTVTISAEGAQSVTFTLNFSITEAQQQVAPTISAQDTTVSGTVDTALSVDLSNYVTVNNADTVIYSTMDTLPSGLTLSTAGVLSGTPTAASQDTIHISIEAENSYDYAYSSMVVDFNIADVPLSFSVTSPITVNKSTGQNINVDLHNYITTNATSITFDDSNVGGNWPSGLTFNNSTGVLSGSVSTSYTGSFAIVVAATKGEDFEDTIIQIDLTVTESSTLDESTVKSIGSVYGSYSVMSNNATTAEEAQFNSMIYEEDV